MDDEQIKKRGAKLAKIARIFAHRGRMVALLRIADAENLISASEAWPPNISPQNRWRLLDPIRGALQIERPIKNEDALYWLEDKSRERLEAVFEALENFADISLSDSEGLDE